MTLDGQAPLLGARARAGLLVTTLLLAAALALSAWANYRAARAAVETLNAGQAEILSTAVRSAEPRGGFQAAPDSLGPLLEAQREAGLRYLALLDPAGVLIASAGEAAAPVVAPTGARPGMVLSGPQPVAGGERVRVFDYRPMSRGPVGEWGEGREAGRGRGAGPPSLGFLVLEFEPVPASTVTAQATLSLGLSGAGAALLTLVALVFWRQSKRYDTVRRVAEQQKRLSQLGEMSAVLAHEIRNPLASLKGNAQLLAEGLETGTKERRRADRVVGEAIRLESLTADLLDFARSGAIARRPVDPVALLRGAAEEAGNGVGATVDAAVAPALWSLDAARLRQALVNLLWNATEVSPEGRPPVARVAEEGGELVYTVRDFGPGLKEGERARIFEPFYTTRTTGTGLGLAVARRVVELHGGRLDADNHPEGGAVFRIALPRES